MGQLFFRNKYDTDLKVDGTPPLGVSNSWRNLRVKIILWWKFHGNHVRSSQQEQELNCGATHIWYKSLDKSASIIVYCDVLLIPLIHTCKRYFDLTSDYGNNFEHAMFLFVGFSNFYQLHVINSCHFSTIVC